MRFGPDPCQRRTRSEALGADYEHRSRTSRCRARHPHASLTEPTYFLHSIRSSVLPPTMPILWQALLPDACHLFYGTSSGSRSSRHVVRRTKSGAQTFRAYRVQSASSWWTCGRTIGSERQKLIVKTVREIQAEQVASLHLDKVSGEPGTGQGSFFGRPYATHFSVIV